MLGNLFKETGVTDRLSETVQNALMNIVTILLSTAVGATMVGSTFLTAQTLKIVVLGNGFTPSFCTHLRWNCATFQYSQNRKTIKLC